MANATEDEHGPLRVLFVCTGNVCRSPMAEVVLAVLCAGLELPGGSPVAGSVVVESAGTSDWHAGSEMDPRARRALDAAGFLADGTLARQVTVEQLDRADVVVALAVGHRDELLALSPSTKVTLLRWWSEGRDLDVFDPYYGDESDFASCLELVVPGCEALARDLAARLGRR